MSLFKQPNELTINSTIKMLVYGQPGLGKSTLALSAPQPVLFDFDGGISRVNKSFQVPTLQVESWQQALDALTEIEAGGVECKSIIIDTAGKMLDYMSDYIISNNSKMKQADGSLTQKGYGVRKTMFINFLNRVTMTGRNIVFVAHEKEEKDDDKRIVRPLMGGASLGDLIRELDLVGYMQAYGNERAIYWSPQEKFYAKNTCNLPMYQKIPVIINENGEKCGENNFLTNVFQSYADYLKQQAEIGDEYTNLIEQIKADAGAIKDAKSADAFVAKMGKYEHIWDSKARARAILAEHTEKLGLTYNKATKHYEHATKD